MHPVDHLVVVAYFALTVTLGIVLGRHQSRREFFAAGGTMGWLTVGLSVMATLFSSNSFVFYSAIAYVSSLRIGLTLVAVSLMAPLVIWVFIPVYARLQCQTAYEYLEHRFDVSVRCLASGLFILLRIGWMASATFAASLVVSSVAGVDQRLVIVSLGIVAIAYTMLGGLRAVMWTDVIQFCVFSTTIALALGLLLYHHSGGPREIVETYFTGRDNLLVDFSPSLTLQHGSWAVLIGIFLEALSAFGVDQVAVQRYISARSERTSQLGFAINLLGMWLVIPALLMIGVGLYAHYRERPEQLVPVLAQHVDENSGELLEQAQHAELSQWMSRQPQGEVVEHVERYYREHPEQVAVDMQRFTLQDHALPQFVGLHFPPGFRGLFLAALLAAIMSSIDSGIHSVTTALIVDFRDRLVPQWRPVVESRDVLVIRGLVVLIGATAVTLALFVGPLGDVFDIGKKATAAFGAPLLAVFVLALLVRGVSTVGVFVGTLVAAVVTLGLMYAYADWYSVWFWPIGFTLAVALALPLSHPWIRNRFGPTQTPLTFRQVMRPARLQNGETDEVS